jgi:hypothetical protein
VRELASADFWGELVLALEFFVGDEISADDEGHQESCEEHADDEEES